MKSQYYELQSHPEELVGIPQYRENLLSTIGRKRALQILLHLKKHKKLRNKELIERLGKISPSTLSSLLSELNREGLIKKRIYGEIPPLAVEYSLTKNGKFLLSVLAPLLSLVVENQ